MTDQIKIWDLPLRVFHWSLVVCLLGSWYSIEIAEDMELHFYFGYASVTLILFRAFWGVIGTFYSRWPRLFFGPTSIWTYLVSFKGSPPQSAYPGHNPLGGLAILFMYGLLLIQVTTGLFSTDEYFFGPLASLVSSEWQGQFTQLHHQSFDALQILIGLHVLAIAFYHVIKHQDLIRPMLTGYKKRSDISPPYPTVRSDRLRRALFIFALSLGLTYVIVTQVADPVTLDPSLYF